MKRHKLKLISGDLASVLLCPFARYPAPFPRVISGQRPGQISSLLFSFMQDKSSTSFALPSHGVLTEQEGACILANRPDLVGTVPIWRPKPDVPPDDPKKPIRPDLTRSTPKKHDFKPAFACSICSSFGIQSSSVSFGLFHVPVRGRRFSKQKICIY